MIAETVASQADDAPRQIDLTIQPSREVKTSKVLAGTALFIVIFVC